MVFEKEEEEKKRDRGKWWLVLIIPSLQSLALLIGESFWTWVERSLANNRRNRKRDCESGPIPTTISRKLAKSN